MNNNISVFNYENSAIRVLEIDGEPWFVGKDVAEVLSDRTRSQTVHVIGRKIVLYRQNPKKEDRKRLVQIVR